MKRILLKIEYNGKDFFGWQKQKTKRTVQGEVELALKKLLGKETDIVGSSRTDAGVHALCQYAHFDTDSKILPYRFAKAITNFLPKDVSVVLSKQVDSNFHARFSVENKTYQYKFYTSTTFHPLKDEKCLQVFTKFDYNIAKECIKSLIGEHDFANLCSTGSSSLTTIRTIYNISLKQDGEDYLFEVCGNAFLYNMVRKIVGTMIQIASGKRPPDYFETLLKVFPLKADKCVPARGLTLTNIVLKDE